MLAVLLSASLFGLYLQKRDILLIQNERIAAKRAAESFALQVNAVIAGGSGSFASFTLPAVPSGNYSLRIQGSRVEVAWPIGPGNSTYSYPLISSAISSPELHPGDSVIIENAGGFVYVS